MQPTITRLKSFTTKPKSRTLNATDLKSEDKDLLHQLILHIAVNTRSTTLNNASASFATIAFTTPSSAVPYDCTQTGDMHGFFSDTQTGASSGYLRGLDIPDSWATLQAIDLWVQVGTSLLALINPTPTRCPIFSRARTRNPLGLSQHPSTYFV
jgi:hypothetical protein